MGIIGNVGLDLFTEYVTFLVIFQCKLFALFQINEHAKEMFFVMDERSKTRKYVRTAFGLFQHIIKLWIIVFVFLVHTVLVVLLLSFINYCHTHCTLHSVIFKKFVLDFRFFVIHSMITYSA